MKRSKCYCEDCKEIFDWSDARKDFTDGGDLGELHYSCPYCGSDFLEDAYECELCGGWFATDEIYGSIGNMVCDKCIEENAGEETLLDFADGNKTEIEINELLASVFSEEDINEFLKKEFHKIRNQEKQRYLNEYLEDTKNKISRKPEFAEYLTM